MPDEPSLFKKLDFIDGSTSRWRDFPAGVRRGSTVMSTHLSKETNPEVKDGKGAILVEGLVRGRVRPSGGRSGLGSALAPSFARSV